MSRLPEGLAVYVRRMSKKRHGTPEEFAERMDKAGLTWIALAGPWHEHRNGKVRTGMMNTVEEIHAYGDALEELGIDVWVWGYPWQGTEETFVDQIAEAAKWGRVLLDPELGSNPKRASKGRGKVDANTHAKRLVRYLAQRHPEVTHCGLSTFGGGVRIGWFPLIAFAKALHKHYPGRSFIGGQTYTDHDAIDPSKEDMLDLIAKFELDVGLVPNFGIYKRVGPERKVRRRNAKELHWHLSEFVDDPTPVDALIGWAENFLTPETEAELARFAKWMGLGACKL